MTGHSNGGQFAWAVAAQLSERVASAVPSAGTPHTGFGAAPAARPVSVMDVHGVNDNICPANWTEPSVRWGWGWRWRVGVEVHWGEPAAPARG